MTTEDAGKFGGSLWPKAFPPYRAVQMTTDQMEKFRTHLFNTFDAHMDSMIEQVGFIVRDASRLTADEASAAIDASQWDGKRRLSLLRDVELLAAMGRLHFGGK